MDSYMSYNTVKLLWEGSGGGKYDGNKFDPDSNFNCVLPFPCDLGHEARVWWALHPGHCPPVRLLARVSVRQHSEQSKGMFYSMIVTQESDALYHV